jgi:hypothetical protein
MYTVQKSSINYLETSRGVAWTARLFRDGDYVGELENRGDGGETSIWTNTNDVKPELEAIAKDNNVMLDTLLNHLVDLAEGFIDPDANIKLPA